MLILKQNAANTVPTPPAGKGTIFLNPSDDLAVKSADGNVTTFPTASGANTQVYFNDDGSFGANANFVFNKSTSVLTITGNIAASNANLGNAATANFFIGSGNNLSNIQGANVTGTVAAATTAGTVTTAAQPNITSVGTLTSLAVTGNASAGNLNTAGAVVASTLTSNVTTGTAPLTVTSTTRVANLNVNYANVADFISVAAGTGNNFLIFANAATGNITELTSTGLIANLSNNSITATTFVGALSGAATSATTAGTVTTNAQPNITSVGTLTSLAVTGNVTAANFIGNLANGNSDVNIPAANGNINFDVAGNANVLVVTGTGVNVNGTLNATGAGQIGGDLLVSGNAVVTGNLAINGNLTYLNVETIAVEDPIIQLQTGANGAAPVANSGKDVGSALNYYNSEARIAFMGWDVSNAEFGMASVATIASEVVTFTTYGNLRVGNIIGNGQALTAIAGANVTGAVAFATTANAVAGANVSGAVAFATTANAVAGANVSGTVANATFATSAGSATTAGTVTTAAQGNITSVGTLTGLTLANAAVISVGSNTNVGTFTGNFSLSAGSRLNATYADLAEKYVADATHEPGTVLEFGGEFEVTLANTFDSTRVAGVVTTNPAYTMNNECEGEHIATIALQGRVPVKVSGAITKGDLLVSASNGHAVANNEARAGTIIGKSLENFTGESGVIEVAVGRF